MEKLNWLKERQKGIGGSDVGAILGVNPYKTSFQVYFEKTEEILKVNETSEAARQGTDFEDYVAKRFTEETGKKVRRDTRHLISKKYPFMVANIDRRVVGEDAILECKTSSPYKLEDWKDGNIPASYEAQCFHYMLVTGVKKVYIACLIFSTDFVIREVNWDDALAETIIDAEKEFWTLVENRTPPALDGSSAAEKYLNERYKETDKEKTVVLTSDYKDKIETLNALKEQEKAIKEQIKEIENNIKLQMEEAEKAYVSTYEIAWKTVTSNRVDSKLLKAEYSDIYEKVCKPSVSRRFQIKQIG